MLLSCKVSQPTVEQLCAVTANHFEVGPKPEPLLTAEALTGHAFARLLLCVSGLMYHRAAPAAGYGCMRATMMLAATSDGSHLHSGLCVLCPCLTVLFICVLLLQPRDLLRMERIILNVLDFRLSGPSCYTFLHLFAQACSNWVTPAVLSLAMYLCELAMLDSHTSSSSYSSKAASALLLAQLSLGSPLHTPFIQAAVMSCLGVDTLQGLSSCLAMLLRLQQIAYQHTLAAVSVSAAAQQGVMSLHMPAPAPSATDHPTGQQGGRPPAPIGTQQQPDDLLAPLRIKFGAECWCGASTIPPLALLPMQV